MDLSLFAPLLVVSGLVLWLPLIGKKWSAIVSCVLFGSLLCFGLLNGYLLLSEPSAGNSHGFGQFFLWIAAIAGAMILLTYFVYRYRQRKAAAAKA
jgi:hypothetical protein